MPEPDRPPRLHLIECIQLTKPATFLSACQQSFVADLPENLLGVWTLDEVTCEDCISALQLSLLAQYG